MGTSRLGPNEISLMDRPAEITSSPNVVHTRIPDNLDTDDSDHDLELGDSNVPASGVPLWTLWPGKNKFFCAGRLMTGPENVAFLVTCGLITAPTLFFIGFVCPGLIHRNSVFLFCPLLALVGLVCMLGTLTICHTSDPGIIPREPAPTKRPSRILNKKLADNSIERWRWCDTCNVYRPPRCHHCSDCDNCVDGFDHHCPWVGNCIAARNYRFFFLFLLSTTVMLLFVFGMSLYYFMVIKNDSSDIAETIGNAPVALGLMIYCGVVFLPVLCLASYHCNIISSGQTTKEEVKRLHESSVNVHDHGCCSNWKVTLFGAVTATRLPDLRAVVNQASWTNEDEVDDAEVHSLMGSGSDEKGGTEIEMNTISSPSPPPYGDSPAVSDHAEEISVSPMGSPMESPMSPMSVSHAPRPSPMEISDSSVVSPETSTDVNDSPPTTRRPTS